MRIIFVILFLLNGVFCNAQSVGDTNIHKAEIILDAIYKNYSVPGSNLLRETFPYDDKYTPDYLAANPGTRTPNAYAFLWPYSGTLSATTALLEATGEKRYIKLLNQKILPGLEKYLDTKRKPAGYASYINTAKPSDRFYDDNIWLGIDFTDLYQITKEKKYLNKAMLIWNFVWSGYDGKLGGGIYWCEQGKTSKNTCSNAPAAVFAFKLFQATKDSFYFIKGKDIYNWTKKYLQDTTDFLYFDNISLKGKVDTRKYSYNSGQMLQAAVLLFRATGDESYLSEAERIAGSAFRFFTARSLRYGADHFRDNNSWFNAVMLRGFAEYWRASGKNIFQIEFQQKLDYYYHGRRDEQGLFYKFSSRQQNTKWLLNQAGFAEIFARLASIK